MSEENGTSGSSGKGRPLAAGAAAAGFWLRESLHKAVTKWSAFVQMYRRQAVWVGFSLWDFWGVSFGTLQGPLASGEGHIFKSSYIDLVPERITYQRPPQQVLGHCVVPLPNAHVNLDHASFRHVVRAQCRPSFPTSRHTAKTFSTRPCAAPSQDSRLFARRQYLSFSGTNRGRSQISSTGTPADARKRRRQTVKGPAFGSTTATRFTGFRRRWLKSSLSQTGP